LIDCWDWQISEIGLTEILSANVINHY